MKGIAIAFLFALLVTMPISIVSHNDLHANSIPLYFNGIGNRVNESTNLSHVIYFNNGKYIEAVEKCLNAYKINFQGGKNYIDIYGNLSEGSIASLEKYKSTFTMLNNTNSQMATPLINYVPTTTNNGDYTYLPQNIWNAYNLTNYSTSYGGSGETVAIVDAYGSPYLSYDLSVFDSTNNLLPANVSIYEPLGPITQNNFNWSIETSTDVEWVHAMAQKAHILLVLVPTPSSQFLQEAINLTIEHGMANVISLSWGLSENQMSPGLLAEYSDSFEMAALDHITVVAASGDHGAYNGGNSLQVNFPASSPYVTGVGGTTLHATDGVFSQTAWGGGSGKTSFGSGGGFSSVFSAPPWQDPYGYNNTMRGVPDVSLDANTQTGVVVVDGNYEYTVGGTSIAAPMWAGMIAILDQMTGHSLGFINPLLYQISRTKYYGKALESVSNGTNGYYHANYGWNPVTGLGTPNLGLMIKAVLKLTGPAGNEAIFSPPKDMTNFNITTNLNLTSSNIPIENGSTYNFLSLQYTPTLGIYSGIQEVNNSYGALIKLSTSYGNYSYFFNITARMNIKLWISVNGGIIKAGVDSYYHLFNIFPEFLYDSYIAIGVERTGIYGNLYGFPGASFTYPNIIGNSNYVSDTYYDLYINNSAPENYSMVNVSSDQRGMNFSYGNPTTPSINPIESVLKDSVQIILTLNQTSGRISGILSQETNNGTFYENGNVISSNVFNFSPSGTYNVSFSSNSLNTYIDILVPSSLSAKLNISSIVNSSDNFNSSLILDYYLHLEEHNGSNLYVLDDNNYISIIMEGFKPFNSNVNASIGNLTVKLIPDEVKLSITSSPGNATVKVNNQTKIEVNGTASFLIFPGKTFVSISHSGFLTVNATQYIFPGQNKTVNVALTPNNKMIAISGIIRNSKYHFGVSSVKVQYNNSDYSYSDSSGYYLTYVPVGSANLTFNATFYTQYVISENSTKDSTIDVNLSFFLNPSSISNPTITLDRAIPLLFYTLFLSWTLSSQSSVSYLEIHYYQLGTTHNHTVRMSAGSTFAFVNGILPGSKYVVYIEVILTDGQYIFSKGAEVSYSNISFLALNISIASFIALGSYSLAISARKRSRRKKAFNKLLEETYGSSKKWK